MWKKKFRLFYLGDENSSLISKLAKIGIFGNFLATFGIESVTSLIEIFFRFLILPKITNRRAKCGCTIHTTLIFWVQMGNFSFLWKLIGEVP